MEGFYLNRGQGKSMGNRKKKNGVTTGNWNLSYWQSYGSSYRFNFKFLSSRSTLSFPFRWHLSIKEESHYRDGLNQETRPSPIPVNKHTNSRLGWTKYIDLCEIVHPSLNLISLSKVLKNNIERTNHYITNQDITEFS